MDLIKATTPCLVTGGAGFIGSHLAQQLVAMGCTVRVVDNLSTGDIANLTPIANQIDFVEGDLCDPSVCARVVDGMQIVFHVAALPSVPRSIKEPWSSHDSNVNATVRLLQACVPAGVERVVYSSSSSVYGDTPTLPKTESMEPLPRSPYAASKLSSEQYVLAYARGGLLEGVALRYFNVFGPRQSPTSAYAAVIPLFLAAVRDGRPATVFGDGSQTRDFTFVADVVAANILAATRPADIASGQVANIGAGNRTSLLDLVALIARVAGRPLHPAFLPARDGDVRHSLADLDRAARVLGYRPTVNLEEGMRRTWEWLNDSTGSVSAARGVGIGTLSTEPRTGAEAALAGGLPQSRQA
jgi:UDP-glucose 4-epimerase